MLKKAFTLIELMVVIVIVSVLAGFVMVQVGNTVNAGKDTKRKADIKILANAVVSYSAENYSKKPISVSPCTINGTCSSEINSALSPFLQTLPSDPNSGQYYTYESDGNDCTISAALSTGETYQYSCSADEASLGNPTAGICGTAATIYAPDETSFDGTYCDSGVISEPSFPEQGNETSWLCPGTYLGASIACHAYHGQNGSCGSLNNTVATAYLPSVSSWPSSNYCTYGDVASSPVFPAQGEYSSWICNAKYSGTNADCVAYRGKDGVCGSSNNGNFYLSSEITSTCQTGTATVSGSGNSTGYFTWTCPAIYSGTSASCTANLKVDGACGSANGGYYESAPTSNLCRAGSASSSGSWTWYCIGLNGGGNSATCTANQRQSCSALGGTTTTCGGASCCKIATSVIYPTGTVCNGNSCYTYCGQGSSVTCPSGWSFNGYTETIENVTGAIGSGSGGYCWYSSGYYICSTGHHSFSYYPYSAQYEWVSYYYKIPTDTPGIIGCLYSGITAYGCQ